MGNNIDLMTEDELRKEADEPIIKCLDQWRSMCTKEIGSNIEVLVGDRHDHTEYKKNHGNFNTSDIIIHNYKLYLVLWIDSLPIKDYLIITHELGHNILYLQGFCSVKICEYEQVEGFFNSLIHHKPLYALQKDLGHNPKEQKLESVANCVKQFKKITQTNNIIETIRNSFLLADHFINNSKDNLTKLKKVLKKNHQETFELVSKINKISKKYNLLIIEENKTFSKHILEYFSKSVSGKLNWRVLDPIDHFRKSVIKASTQDTNDT